jgi:hypothetical protein
MLTAVMFIDEFSMLGGRGLTAGVPSSLEAAPLLALVVLLFQVHALAPEADGHVVSCLIMQLSQLFHHAVRRTCV